MELNSCPHCGKSILAVAKTCKHCKKSVDFIGTAKVQPNSEAEIEDLNTSISLTKKADSFVTQSVDPDRQEGNVAQQDILTERASRKSIGLKLLIVLLVLIALVILASTFSQQESDETESTIATKFVQENYEDTSPTAEGDEGIIDEGNDIANSEEYLIDNWDDQRIMDFIDAYYTMIQNMEFERIPEFFAPVVPEFFNKSFVQNDKIKDDQIKYQNETLKTISIRPEIRWNSFEITHGDNKAHIQFFMDYYLNTQRYGNQLYVLKVNIDINEEYQIIGIHEDTLERSNLE